jgi:hypothetical protein
MQVNLFMHQVTPNAAWRNVGLPSLAPDGTTRLSNPPLALDLHYLLTAYASGDCEAEALLGYAIQMMYETPVLPRAQIRAGLTSLPAANPLSTLLGGSGLADQIEMIKLTPATMGREELAWLWTALKADYRPTFPFDVSVVLIQSSAPMLSPLPVLQRSVSAQPSLVSPFSSLTSFTPPHGQTVACLGDIVTVSGSNLGGATAILLSNARQGVQSLLTPLANVGPSSFQFTVPNPAVPNPASPNDLPAGLYLATAQVASGTDTLSTNGLPMAISPKISAGWPAGPIPSGASVAVTVPCTPYLRVGQSVSLSIGGQQASANTFTAPTRAPTFTFATLQPTGQPVPAWLRVDGIDSPIIDTSKTPPVFTGPMVQVT